MKANNDTEKLILDYFEANASDDLKKRVEEQKKTIAGAINYASSEAKKRGGNCVMVDDKTVFGWVMHYFEDVDAKQFEGKGPIGSVKVAKPVKKAEPKKPAAKAEPKKPEDPQMMLFPLEAK